MEKEFRPGLSEMEKAKMDAAEGREVDFGKAEWETIIGKEEGIRNTENTIAKLKSKGKSVSELEMALETNKQSLINAINQAIEDTKNRIAEHKERGVDYSYLESHLNNLQDKLPKEESVHQELEKTA